MHLPSAEQERVLRTVRDALPREMNPTPVASHRHYAHWEDESLGDPPRAITLTFAFQSGPFRVACRTTTDDRIEASFATFASARDPRGSYQLRLSAEDRARLRAHGWQYGSLWEGRWALDESAIVAALNVISDLAPTVLLPDDLPPARAWPWIALIELGLFAECVVGRVANPGKYPWRVTTRVDGREHTLLLSAEDDALLTWWFSEARVLRPVAGWW